MQDQQEASEGHTTPPSPQEGGIAPCPRACRLEIRTPPFWPWRAFILGEGMVRQKRRKMPRSQLPPGPAAAAGDPPGES